MPRLAVIFALLLAFSDSARAASAGTGLWGQYFQDTGWSEYVTGRVDPQVNFSWGNAVAPVAGVRDSTFSVRWRGQVEALCSDNYTFSTISDDGIELYIDGNLVISNLTTHSNTTDFAAPIYLTAGALVTIELSFFENYGSVSAVLQWQAPSCIPASVAIPSAQLYPNIMPSPTPLPTATPLPLWACPVPDDFNGGLIGAWNFKTINRMSMGGSLSYASGAMLLSADGTGMQTGPVFSETSSGDSAHFMYQAIRGDFDVALQINSVSNLVGGGQGGLMMRESTNEGSRQAYIGAVLSGSFQESHRLSAGAGNAGTSSGGYSNGTPAWVRLMRTGSVIQAYTSPDGSAWTPLGAANNFPGLANDLLLGPASSSQEAGILRQASFNQFVVLSAGCQTATPTITPTPTNSPTWSASPSGTLTPTITESFTHSPTYSETATITPSPTNTPTFSVSPSFSHSPTFTDSPSITPTFSVSPTYTPTPGRPLSSLVVYPNPFSDRLWIGFTLGGPSRLELLAYNVAGEEVYRTTLDAPTGTQTLSWNGSNTQGIKLASGVYLLRLRADGGAVGLESQWATVALIR